jgi:hypothetical protein
MFVIEKICWKSIALLGAIAVVTPLAACTFPGQAENDRYIHLSSSEGNNSDRHVDLKTLTKLSDNTFQYTIVVGSNRREFESEAIVNCSDLRRVELKQARFYNENGQVDRTEQRDRKITVRPNDPNQVYYEANRAVCERVGDSIAVPPPEEIAYETYYNSRFNYAVKYPIDLLVPQGEAQNGDGQSFISEDNQIVMSVYGTHHSLQGSLDRWYREATRGSDRREVTYKTRRDNWFVVSGYDDGFVFYQKVVEEREEGGVFKVLELRYRRSLQPQFDPVVAEIANSFTSNPQ